MTPMRGHETPQGVKEVLKSGDQLLFQPGHIGAGQKLLWQNHGLAKQSQQHPGGPGCCGLFNHTSRHGVDTTACPPMPA
jgi:hypothetical protein